MSGDFFDQEAVINAICEQSEHGLNGTRRAQQRRRIAPWLAMISAVAGVLLLAAPRVPLGVSGEWVWTRHDLPVSMLEWCDRLLAPVTGALLVMGTAVAGERVLRKSGFLRSAGMLLLLILTSLIWQRLVLMAAPSPHREIKPLWINYDKYASGYFFEAAFRMHSAASLLVGYEDRMREGDVLHVGTHPPGLFLFSWCALQATARSPTLVRILEVTRDRTSESLFREIESRAGLARPLYRTELAALQLMAAVTQLSIAAAGVPLFLLAMRAYDRLTSWRVACCLVTIPGVLVFFPKSDVLYLLTMTSFLWLAVTSLTVPAVWSLWLSAAGAGVVLCGCLLLSLAHLPGVAAVVLFAVLQHATAVDGRTGPRRSRMTEFAALLRPGRKTGALVILFGTFLLTVVVWNVTTNCQLFRVWQLNLTNHAGFYQQSPRTWWKWLLLNPLELGFAAGLPLSVIALAGGLGAVGRVSGRAVALRKCADRDLSGLLQASVGDCLTTALFLTWMLLWLSGKNLGEAARLWCFLTPWVTMAAAGSDAGRRSPADCGKGLDAPAKFGITPWRLLLLLQLITAIATVGRVNGFSV